MSGETWQEPVQAPGMTRAVRFLIISTAAAYLLQLFFDGITHGGFTHLFGLSIRGLKSGYLWQLVTYLFVHGSPTHIFLNMLGLYFMGPETERAVGSRHFLILYFLSGILGGIGWLFISEAPWAVCIGASGAIFGVIGAFAALFPQRPITLLVLFVLPVTMKAWMLAVSLAVVELVFLLSTPQQGIAYAAHLAGGVAGYVYALALFRGLGGVTRAWRNWRREEPVSQVELDRILDKIAREGIHTLSRQERKVLEEASRSAKRQQTTDN
jgi:membrane associated rhomboid family serine protease